MKVSVVTIANGNDNIAIYLSIFVKSISGEIVAYGLGFYLWLVFFVFYVIILYIFLQYLNLHKNMQNLLVHLFLLLLEFIF
jgi:cadmium resistance protein CadD (predicted permease)